MNAGLLGRSTLACSRWAAKLNASGGGSTGLRVIGVSLARPKLSADGFSPNRRPVVWAPQLAQRLFASSLCNIILHSSLGGRPDLVKQRAILANRNDCRGARRRRKRKWAPNRVRQAG